MLVNLLLWIKSLEIKLDWVSSLYQPVDCLDSNKNRKEAYKVVENNVCDWFIEETKVSGIKPEPQMIVFHWKMVSTSKIEIPILRKVFTPGDF